MRRKPIKFYALLAGLLFMVAANACAQEVSVEAEVSSRKVALGSTIRFTITISGNHGVDHIPLPPFEGFEVNYLGPSTRVSVVNGQYFSSKSFVYSLFPLKEGTFEIPSIDVSVAGRTFTLQAVPVEVVASAEDGAPPGQDQPMSLKDKLFIVLKAPKEEVYLNEPLPVKIFLFISGLSARDIQYPVLNNIGYTIGEYEKPQQYQQLVNGIRYNVVEFNTKIYPTREGALQLGPARVECNLLVQSADRASRFGGSGGIFDDDFFNSFFDRHEKRPIVLESDAVTVDVLALPQEGRPGDFSGAVGEFGFNVSVSPDEVKAGDPLTLRMTVMGKGNLASVKMPALPLDDDFKVYDPQVFEKDNIKKSEQVVIPQSPEITQVPALRFSYFDPQLKKYRTITRGPFPVKVRKLEEGESFKVVGLDGEYRPVEPESLGQDIVFIKNRPGKLRVAGRHVYNSAAFYVFIVLAFGVWLGAFVHYKRTRRMKTDIVYARRLLAPRQAKQGLAKAKKLIASGKRREFYDTVFKTTQQYLGNKLHLSAGAVTADMVQRSLGAKHMDGKTVRDIKAIFDECDMIRYASADIDQEQMNASYQRLASTIDHLERHLK